MNSLFTVNCAMVQCPKCGSGLIETIHKPGKSPVFDAVEGTVTHLNVCRNCGHKYEIVFEAKEVRGKI